MKGVSLDDWVNRWRTKAYRTTPLTSEEWREVRRAMDDLYVLSGHPRPVAVVQVRSPHEAMAKSRMYLDDRPMSEVHASIRVVESIRGYEAGMLGSIRSFSGNVAAQVDDGSLSPRIWGVGLHPHMATSPCTGNLRAGVAAELTWMLKRGQLPTSPSTRRGVDAIVGRCVAGPARLLRDRVFVSDMPTSFAVDEDGQLHNETGPAVRWADGAGLNIWHGIGVPHDFFRWSVERALGEVNVEVRRCAIERIGVDRLEQSLRLLAEAPDPANPPQVLRLYDLPRAQLSGRLLVVDNASLDKGGHRRRFHLFVPPHITDPLEAAANSFGLTTEEYLQLQRAT